jgi:hypothetical protein
MYYSCIVLLANTCTMRFVHWHNLYCINSWLQKGTEPRGLLWSESILIINITCTLQTTLDSWFKHRRSTHHRPLHLFSYRGYGCRKQFCLLWQPRAVDLRHLAYRYHAEPSPGFIPTTLWLSLTLWLRVLTKCPRNSLVTLVASFEWDVKLRFLVLECLCQGKHRWHTGGKCVTWCGLAFYNRVSMPGQAQDATQGVNVQPAVDSPSPNNSCRRWNYWAYMMLEWTQKKKRFHLLVYPYNTIIVRLIWTPLCVVHLFLHRILVEIINRDSQEGTYCTKQQRLSKQSYLNKSQTNHMTG